MYKKILIRKYRPRSYGTKEKMINAHFFHTVCLVDVDMSGCNEQFHAFLPNFDLHCQINSIIIAVIFRITQKCEYKESFNFVLSAWSRQSCDIIFRFFLIEKIGNFEWIKCIKASTNGFHTIFFYSTASTWSFTKGSRFFNSCPHTVPCSSATITRSWGCNDWFQKLKYWCDFVLKISSLKSWGATGFVFVLDN